jgi:hypothetical protein
MPLYYQTGEEIRKGDKILLDGRPGEIEFVVDPSSPLQRRAGISRNTAAG